MIKDTNAKEEDDDQQDGYGKHTLSNSTRHSFVSFVQHEQIWNGSKGSTSHIWGFGRSRATSSSMSPITSQVDDVGQPSPSMAARHRRSITYCRRHPIHSSESQFTCSPDSESMSSLLSFHC